MWFNATLLQRIRDNDPTLTSLDLTHNKIGVDDARAIAEALKTNTTVKSLDLGWNKIGAAGARVLVEALQINTTLTSLDLRGNEIGYDGAIVVAWALKTNTSVTSMKLELNKIGDWGARNLAEALKTNTTLTSLDLRNNRIGDWGASFLAETLKINTTVTSLDLGGNEIGDRGARNLAWALRINTTVTSLDLGGNEIGNEGASVLVEALKGNMVLSFFGYSNKYDREISSVIATYVERNKALAPCLNYLNSLRKPLSPKSDASLIDESAQALPINESMLVCLLESSSPATQSLAKLALANALRRLVHCIGLEDEEVAASLGIIRGKTPTKAKHPETGYLLECYSILHGLLHISASPVQKTKDIPSRGEMYARDFLLPPFTDDSLQSIANIALGQLLSLSFSEHLLQAPPEQQTALRQLVLHCLKDQQNHEFLSPFFFGALWRLQNPGAKDKFQDIPSLRDGAIVLSYDEILAFAQQALTICKKSGEQNLHENEINLLKLLLNDKTYRPGVLGYISQSPAFISALHRAHRKKNILVCLEDCLVLAAKDKPHLLNHLPKAPLAITAKQVAELSQVIKQPKFASYFMDEQLAFIRKQVAAITPAKPKKTVSSSSSETHSFFENSHPVAAQPTPPEKRNEPKI